MTLRPLALLTLAVLALSSVGLAACGKQAALERPAPMWDPAKKAAWEAQRRAASSTANQTARVGGAQEIMDPASSNRTVRAAPLAGTGSSPFGGPSAAGFPGATPN